MNKDFDLLPHFLNSNGVSIDTRTIKKGEMFFAIEGDNFDGHDYIENAISKGANYVVGQKDLNLNKASYIQVNDSVKTLQNLATSYRLHLDIPLIGITGSNGKTTNKELINQVLSTQYSTYCTEGNLNNHLGVPLSLLRIPKQADLAIIEMGANHQAEISLLCNIAQPNYGLITNIGKAHLDGFGGIEGVKKGKRELFDFIINNQGQFFLNDLEPSLDFLHQNSNKSIVRISKILEGVSVTYSVQEFQPLSIVFNDSYILNTELYGHHQLKNMLTAIAIGLHFNITLIEIIEQLQKFQTGSNRFSITKYGNNEVYLDAYNANPSSMIASISTFAKLKGHSKIIILGEMLELGEYSEQEHSELLDYCHSLDTIEEVWCYGQSYVSLENGAHTTYFDDFKSLQEAFGRLREGSSKQILIKGSRGNKLERLLAQNIE